MASNRAMRACPVTRPPRPVCHPGTVPGQRMPTGTKTGTLKGALPGCPARILHVPIQHEEDPMNQTLATLDHEWDAIKASPASCEALREWGRLEPTLDGLADLDHLLKERTRSEAAPAMLSALARLAAHDQLAARTLLQALVPGLLRFATTGCRDDPTAFEELIAIAWVRIRTYPQTRDGSVAANIVLDVRKNYRSHRAIESPKAKFDQPGRHAEVPSAEDTVLAGSALGDLLALASRRSAISPVALNLIVRTRVDLVPLDMAAREQQASYQHASHIRWRAERRLRPILARVS